MIVIAGIALVGNRGALRNIGHVWLCKRGDVSGKFAIGLFGQIGGGKVLPGSDVVDLEGAPLPQANMKQAGNLALCNTVESPAGSKRAFERQLWRKGSGLLVRWPRPGLVVDDRECPVMMDVDAVGPAPEAEAGTGDFRIRSDVGFAVTMGNRLVAGDLPIHEACRNLSEPLFPACRDLRRKGLGFDPPGGELRELLQCRIALFFPERPLPVRNEIGNNVVIDRAALGRIRKRYQWRQGIKFENVFGMDCIRIAYPGLDLGDRKAFGPCFNRRRIAGPWCRFRRAVRSVDQPGAGEIVIATSAEPFALLFTQIGHQPLQPARCNGRTAAHASGP